VTNDVGANVAANAAGANVVGANESKTKTKTKRGSKKSFVSTNLDPSPKSRTLKARTPKAKTPKVATVKEAKLTTEEKEAKINIFLNKIGLSVKEIPWDDLKELARQDGITLDTEQYKFMLRIL
jgi:hypothetical protein